MSSGFVESSFYNEGSGVLHLTCPVLPREIGVVLHDHRGRDTYTARVRRFKTEDRWQAEVDELEDRLYDYDNYIQWLCQFVPEDRWDEVYGQITRMGIDYRGADD